MGIGIGDIEVRRDGELEETVPNRLEPLQVDEIVGTSGGQRLKHGGGRRLQGQRVLCVGVQEVHC